MTRHYRPVGEAAVLVEFGDTIDRTINRAVIGLDRAIAAAQIAGVRETVPAYASLLVIFDVEETDHTALIAVLETLDSDEDRPCEVGRLHQVAVAYGGASGPDLDDVARTCAMPPEAVIAAHAAVEYRVYMGGFAPGYAYLGDVPEGLWIPRKSTPQAGHPPGSVMIAGGQCLISTLPMPTGWWVIGHTEAQVFARDAPDPFLLKPGGRVRFVPL